VDAPHEARAAGRTNIGEWEGGASRGAFTAASPSRSSLMAAAPAGRLTLPLPAGELALALATVALFLPTVWAVHHAVAFLIRLVRPKLHAA